MSFGKVIDADGEMWCMHLPDKETEPVMFVLGSKWPNRRSVRRLKSRMDGVWFGTTVERHDAGFRRMADLRELGSVPWRISTGPLPSGGLVLSETAGVYFLYLRYGGGICTLCKWFDLDQALDHVWSSWEPVCDLIVHADKNVIPTAELRSDVLASISIASETFENGSRD